MTQNPFGEGGLDLDAMMQQAQQMQQQVEKLQSDLMAMTFEGTASGVTVTVTGGGEMTSVVFAPTALEGVDAEDAGDLVLAAYRDAKAQSDAKTRELFGPLSEGLGGLGGLGV
jgi:nucleoid-associated protein EbfC